MNACFHCGDALPARAIFTRELDGQLRAFCCAGCEAVAATIIEAGLGDYYTQRQKSGRRPERLDPDLLDALRQYDQPQTAATLSLRSGPEGSEVDLLIEGMTCAACAWLAERRLRALPAVTAASVTYATGRGVVRWDATRLPLSALLQELAGVGLDARPADQARDPVRARKLWRRQLLEWLVAGLVMMQVMMYSIPVYLAEAGEISPEFDQLMRWASLVLCLPVLTFSARSFFVNAWHGLRLGQVGMDVPVALALLLTYAASAAATVSGQGEVYFDSISMFVFLLLSARLLEQRARNRATRAMERLAPPLPPWVEKLEDWPHSMRATRVSGTALAIGDIVRLPSGGTVAADGELLEGLGSLDESLLTGESRPVTRRIGEPLMGGSVNLGDPLIMRISRTGESSTLAQIAQLARQALRNKPEVQGLAHGLALYFSIGVLMLAGLTWLYWMGSDADAAFRHMVAVLVVTCPCALALAQPAALAAGTGRLSQWGLLAISPRALDSLAGVTDVVFDKTGTLTDARLHLQAIHTVGAADANQVLALAAAMEAGSLHPLALTLRREAETRDLEPVRLTDIRHFPGRGIEATWHSARLRLGRPDFVAEIAGYLPVSWPQSSAEGTVVALGCTSCWLAQFSFTSPLRPGVAEAVATLHQRGLQVHLLSGDQSAVVDAVNRLVHIGHVQGNALPDDKRAYVAALQAQGRRVLMVGDGCNDAPVLAQADCAIAMAADREGTDLARAQADLLLLHGRLQRIPDAIALAQRTRHTMRTNLIWALVYNLCSVPLAMSGLISPWVAALGMSASSLFVVANAGRLLQFEPATPTNEPATPARWALAEGS